MTKRGADGPPGAANRQLRLGAILEGVGADHASWRDPDLKCDASIDIAWYVDCARRAEAAKFDLIFIVDGSFITPESVPQFLNRLEPISLLSALAVCTSRIGLVATLTTSYWEPYNVARQVGSLDHISHGRAAWNVVTTGIEGASTNYGREEHLDHTLRYARAREFVDVVQGLWDSYEDDAFPCDKQAGIFLDKTRQHALNHKGAFFSVAGPLALSRSGQGQPVIFQAGDSEQGRLLGAAIADGTFTGADTFDSARTYYADLKARAMALGRDPDQITIMTALSPVIAATDAEADALAASERGMLDMAKLLAALGRAFGYHDFTQYELDAPFPDVTRLSLNSYRGRAEHIIRTIRDDSMTLRQAALRFGAWNNEFVGSPATIADRMERWLLERATDGFNLRVSRPGMFALFCEQVVPILQARGLFRLDYTSDTLRGHLGLPVPENRYTAKRRVSVRPG